MISVHHLHSLNRYGFSSFRPILAKRIPTPRFSFALYTTYTPIRDCVNFDKRKWALLCPTPQYARSLTVLNTETHHCKKLKVREECLSILKKLSQEDQTKNFDDLEFESLHLQSPLNAEEFGKEMSALSRKLYAELLNSSKDNGEVSITINPCRDKRLCIYALACQLDDNGYTLYVETEYLGQTDENGKETLKRTYNIVAKSEKGVDDKGGNVLEYVYKKMSSPGTIL